METISDLLPHSWFTEPYAHYYALRGVTLDNGHDTSTVYGDDGKLIMRCRLCHASLALGKDTRQDTSLLDTHCPVIVGPTEKV